MRNLANTISESLLPRVIGPGQYVGLEINARRGDIASAEVTVALAFPDAYTIGISHLGSQILYQMLNDIPGVVCDRTYCPMPDAEQVMRDISLPLFGWESRAAVADFDILGFSLPYELCVTNVLTMLDLAGIELCASDRSDDDPLIVGGDALADSPEPLAEFFDLFITGDGERPLAELVALVRQMKPSGATRQDILLAAARQIESVYVPSLYKPVYDEQGGVKLAPIVDGIPTLIRRAHLSNLSESPVLTRPLVPLVEGVHDRVTIEIMRGCPNGCRYCQAGLTRLPVRIRSVAEIVTAARQAIDATGYREISLLSLSTSDYPHLTELITKLNDEFEGEHVSISLPSLKVSEQLRHLPKMTSVVRKAGLTIAAEAGTDRLRQSIGKDIRQTDMCEAVRAAYESGLSRVKVYFMAGLPGETDEDIDAILDLCLALSDTRRDVDGQRGSINASVSWFVPKPHTPLQWAGMGQMERFFEIRERLISRAKRTPVNVKFHWIERSFLEAVIARGDRRLAPAIEAAWRAGARMDSWNEHFDYKNWEPAFAGCDIDAKAIACNPIPLDRSTPWSHIQCHRSLDFLIGEFQRGQDILAD